MVLFGILVIELMRKALSTHTLPRRRYWEMLEQCIYLAMGILIGSAVVPIALTASWKKTNKNAAIKGSILGCVAGGMFLATATWLLYGQLSVTTTGETTPLLIGNVVFISVAAYSNQNFNFELMKQMILVFDDRSDLS